MLACYLLGGYVIHHWLSSPARAKSFRTSLRPLFVCGIVTLLIAGMPILLTYLFVESSNRPDVEFFEAGRGSLHPAFLLTAFVPDLFSMIDPKVEYWGPASKNWSAEWLSLSKNMGQIYIGALPIMALSCLACGVASCSAREIRFFTVATLVMLIYALGRYTPAFELLYIYVPGVAMFRRPADATFLLGGTLAILGGYLIHVNLTRDVGPATPRDRVFQAMILGTVLVASLAIAIYFGKLDYRHETADPSVLLLSTATALLIYNRQLGRFSVHIPVVLLSGFMVLDLAQNNGPNEFHRPVTGQI